jgi:hypothetical protein
MASKNMVDENSASIPTFLRELVEKIIERVIDEDETMEMETDKTALINETQEVIETDKTALINDETTETRTNKTKLINETQEEMRTEETTEMHETVKMDETAALQMNETTEIAVVIGDVVELVIMAVCELEGAEGDKRRKEPDATKKAKRVSRCRRRLAAVWKRVKRALLRVCCVRADKRRRMEKIGPSGR